MFSVTVLHDERIVIVAEQRPDSTEEDSFQWMSRVLQVAHSCPEPLSWAHVSFPAPLCSLIIPPFDQRLHQP